MKREDHGASRLGLWIVAVLLCIGLFGCLFQFGPPSILPGDDRILATMRIADGDSLYIVAHRTSSLLKTYEVSLYRVLERTNFFVCFLGNKEPYWWGCSLRRTSIPERIEIRVGWAALATYSLPNGIVISEDKVLDGRPTYRMDGVKVTWPVPKVLLKKGVP